MDTEELQDQPTVMGVSMKYGLFAGLVLIAYGLVIQLAGLVANQALGYVSFIFLIVFIVLGHKAYKDDGDGYMAYGKGLGIGTMISLISGILSSVFSYIYITFIDDSMIAIMKEVQEDALIKQGLEGAALDNALEMASSFLTPGMMFVMGIVSMLFIGFILSLIVAAITKNTNPEMEV